MATIRKRGDRWHVQIRREGYPKQTCTKRTRAEAEKWARSIENEFDRGLNIDRGEAEKNTLLHLFQRYLAEITPSKKGAATEAVRIRKLMKDSIAQYKAAALSGRVLADYRDRRLEEVSGSTVNRELNIISHVITVARKEWGIQIENPVAMIRRPPENRARERRLHKGEEFRLLSSIDDEPRNEKGQLGSGTRNPWLKPIVLFAIETGMRRSEMLSLKWKDIDLENHAAHLHDTKNASAREVPLSSQARKVLKELPRSLDGRVFPTTADAVKKAFQRACERAGIENFHFHDLRHEATSRLATRRDNVLELAAVTGNKDLRMLKRYFHPKAKDISQKLG
jgi:integrase